MFILVATLVVVETNRLLPGHYTYFLVSFNFIGATLATVAAAFLHLLLEYAVHLKILNEKPGTSGNLCWSRQHLLQ